MFTEENQLASASLASSKSLSYPQEWLLSDRSASRRESGSPRKHSMLNGGHELYLSYQIKDLFLVAHGPTGNPGMRRSKVPW